MRIRHLLSIILIISSFQGLAQFAPPVGQEGSTAISADSAIFIGWGEVVEIERGPMSVDSLILGNADYGVEEAALGKADNIVISLGDGGSADFFFSTPIENIEGPDFAVFENSFTDDFLELCFVEVSSDGINYFRFDAISLTQTDDQISSYGILDATKLNNLGGKYRGMYGTPFDLEELDGIVGLDISNITNIRVIDVIGSINPVFATTDSHGNFVNDPWPTGFNSSGFDLDALGIINPELANISNIGYHNSTNVYPNPAINRINIETDKKISGNILIEIIDITGSIVFSEIYYGDISSQIISLNIDFLNPGIYNLRLSGIISETRKFIITN